MANERIVIGEALILDQFQCHLGLFISACRRFSLAIIDIERVVIAHVALWNSRCIVNTDE